MTSYARRAYHVVDLFEQELARYTGAPHVVAVDSCTNGIHLSLEYAARHLPDAPIAWLPRRTYIGVLQAALNASYEVRWNDDDPDWQARGWYRITPGIVDSARHLAHGMYQEFPLSLVCLSFHAAKQLRLGRGGAILTDSDHAARWLRAARMDGRPPGSAAITFPGWHYPMPQEHAALGLAILSRDPIMPPLTHEEYADLSAVYRCEVTA